MPQNKNSEEARNDSAGQRAARSASNELDRSHERGTVRGQPVDSLPAGYARNDEAIRQDVMTRIDEQVELEAEEVDVAVADGIVTLSGTVNDDAARSAAEHAARSVQGVREVQNKLLNTH